MELPKKMLLVVLIAFGALLLCSAAPPPTITEKLDVTQQHPTEASYLSFMTRLDSAVKRTTTESVLERPLLGEQKLWTTPAYWINVELMDAAGKRLVTLALRSDNLYVSGFANQHGEWFAFKGQQNTLPGSRELSYKGDYADIFGPGVGYRGLGSVQVNRAQALANALLLAKHRSGSSPDTALKPALGFFILTISESERFPTLRAALARAMDAPATQTMSQALVKLAVNWKRLSCALRSWVLHKQAVDAWNVNTEAIELRAQIGVTTPQEALARIQPMLRSKGCSWTPFTERLDITQLRPTKATYLSFMTRLDSAIKRTTTESVLEHPLLGEQKLWATPAYWITVELKDATGKGLVTLALRSDNLYVSGFANRHGEWFTFMGQQKTLPGSTELSYKGDYTDIFGPNVDYRGLGSVQVNRARALASALLLADYRSGLDDTALKPALGFFILTIGEAERFPTLRAELAGAMDAQTPQTMSQSLVKLAVNWKRLSCALRSWDRHGQTMVAWNGNVEAIELQAQIGVTTPQEALARIYPMLRSEDKDCTWTPRSPQFISAE